MRREFYKWDRRCLENYLIEFDVLTDLIKNEEITRERTAISSVTDTQRLLCELALAQLDGVVARRVYQTVGQYFLITRLEHHEYALWERSVA